ncbi:hypothetical protein ACTFIU_006117 [Dictyostelium citrinum]
MKFYSIILFCFLFFFKSIKCIDVESSDLSCLINLGTKTFVNAFIDTNTQTTFCSIQFNKCYSNGSIEQLELRQNNTVVLSWSDFSCFSSITSLKLHNSYLVSDFLYTPISSIKQIYLYSSNISSIDQEVPNYDILLASNLTNVIKASYLKNVKSFSMFGGLAIFDTEGDQSNSALQSISITSPSIPILSVFPNLLIFSIYSEASVFNESSLENLIPLNKLNSLSIDINSPNVDIFSIITSISNSSLNYIYIGQNTQMGPAKQKYNLSNFKQLNQILAIGNNTYFNYEGQFPFSSFPKISFLYITKGNFSFPQDLNIFENVTNINFNGGSVYGILPKYTPKVVQIFSLNANKLTGSVNEDWCNTNIDFSFNQLSGQLPDCFYCYLNVSSVSNSFKGNNFTNFNTNNNDCGYSQISIYRINIIGTSFTLFGKNMGPFENIISTPSLSFNRKNLDGSFTGYFSNIQNAPTIELRLKSPGINFTIATLPQNPTISSIFQSNNTFIINGSYFSYDQSSLNVRIGKNMCNISSSTFYQIQCEISYPVADKGSIEIIVTGSGLSSSKTFEIIQTTQPCNPNDCNGNGVCDHVYGICKCNRNWLTVGNQICLIANHFISSSTQVDSTTGGNITLYGLFGAEHQSPQLTIDGVNSPIFSINDNSIVTSIQVGTGSKSITFIQNGITWSGTIYPYIIKIFTCPNNCGGKNQGSCNTSNGQCQCLKGYTGFDCSPLPSDTKDEPISTTFIAPTGLTTISNEQTAYQLSINSVVEVDFNGNEISSSLIQLSGNWKLESNQSSISTFKQQLENTTFVLTIEEIVNSDKQFSFAGNEFTITKGGIKISFSISNWNYQSNLNTLRVEMISDITIDDNKKDINTCNDDSESSFESSSNSQGGGVNNLNYLKFSINGKILQGRFQDKMLSDGRPAPTFSKVLSKINNKVTLGLELPHCIECLLDPDFSVLLSPDFKSSDSCKSNKKSWLIPVVVVVPVVGVAIIITVVVVILKKHSVKIRIGLRNISMSSIKDRSKK